MLLVGVYANNTVAGDIDTTLLYESGFFREAEQIGEQSFKLHLRDPLEMAE